MQRRAFLSLTTTAALSASAPAFAQSPSTLAYVQSTSAPALAQSTSARALAQSTSRPAFARSSASAVEHIATLERRSRGGRLGVYALDTDDSRTIAHRAAERFPMCSTFKVLTVAAVLARVDRRAESLDRHIAYGKRDLLAYAPITSAHVDRGSMSIESLCAAAIEVSDNTAANLLLNAIGGPAEVTHYARKIGDARTRLDRNEPSLNTALPRDMRDTTTPHVMALNLCALTIGSALSIRSRDRLVSWLNASTTGAQRLRAGLPHGWRCGDKTGSGDNGTTNDIALVQPPTRKTIVIAAYLTGSTLSQDGSSALLAGVGRIVSECFA